MMHKATNPRPLPGMGELLIRHQSLAFFHGKAAMLLSASELDAGERRQLRQALLLAQRFSRASRAVADYWPSAPPCDSQSRPPAKRNRYVEDELDDNSIAPKRRPSRLGVRQFQLA